MRSRCGCVSAAVTPTCHGHVSATVTPTCHRRVSAAVTPTCHGHVSEAATPTCHRRVSTCWRVTTTWSLPAGGAPHQGITLCRVLRGATSEAYRPHIPATLCSYTLLYTTLVYGMCMYVISAYVHLVLLQ